jgi:flavin reductase (DIM6/NTAB) family NADH-FMN oxidoreductase RutF
MLNFFKKKTRDQWLESPMHDNWYQSSAYFCSSFALITSVNEAGVTSIGPYQLSFPFGVIHRREWIVISRKNSNTSNNLKRIKKCAMNFVEYDKRFVPNIVDLGYPGQEPEEKMKDCLFELEESPTESYRKDPERPKVIKNAFQVFECNLNDNPEDFFYKGNEYTDYLLLEIQKIYLREQWRKNLDLGDKTKIPNMPISYGFRNANQFWFAQHGNPYWLPTPEDKGAKHDAVMYIANRIDPEITFTEDACKLLTGIPKVFVKTALKGIIAEAKKEGITEIDESFVQMINEKRTGGS